MDKMKKFARAGGAYSLGIITVIAPKLVIGLLIATLIVILFKLSKDNLKIGGVVTLLILLALIFGVYQNINKKEIIEAKIPEIVVPEIEVPEVEATIEKVETPEIEKTSSENVVSVRMSKEQQNSKVSVRTNPTEREVASEIPTVEKGDDSIDAVIEKPVEKSEEFQVETPATAPRQEEVQEETSSDNEITESDFKEELFEESTVAEPRVESDFSSKDLVAEEVVSNQANEFSDVEISEEKTEGLVEQQVQEAPQEETKELTIEALDGYETVVGSRIQFEISDPNATIEGLDGIEYSFENGSLNIFVGSEATVLTVQVSNSTSVQTFDITVNGIVG